MIPRHKGKNPLGISFDFISNPLKFTYAVADEMGDFYTVTVPRYRIYVISDPELIRHVLVNNSRNYIKGEIYWKQLARGVGKGLATTEGAEWLQRRRLMQPYFNRNEVFCYTDAMGKIAARYYDEKLGNKKEGVVVNMMQLANEATAEITLSTLLGLDSPQSKSEFYQKISRSQEFILYCTRYPWNKLLTILNGRKKMFDRDVAYFDKLVYQFIRERREETSPNQNVLTALVKQSDEKGNATLSDKQVRDEFLTMLGAGSETSSTCFTWTLYLLWKHPEKLARIKEEIEDLLDIDETITKETINQLKYTENVLKESLRLYPPGYAIIREAKEDDLMGEEKIPKGSTIYIAASVLHRHKKYWNNPNEFFPERFEINEEGTTTKLAFIPFGAGQHACIGSQFAIAELKVLLATLLRRYDFTLGREDNMEILSRITPHPKGGMPFKFIKRCS